MTVEHTSSSGKFLLKWGWLFMFVSFLLVYLYAGQLHTGIITWHAVEATAGLSAVTTGVIYGLVRLNFWWLGRIRNDSVLLTVYLVVLATLGIGIPLGIISSFSSLGGLTIDIFAVGMAVVAILILRRARMRSLAQT